MNKRFIKKKRSCGVFRLLGSVKRCSELISKSHYPYTHEAHFIALTDPARALSYTNSTENMHIRN